jgi:hypothetical protein
MVGFLGTEMSWKDGGFEIPSCDEGVLLYFYFNVVRRSKCLMTSGKALCHITSKSDGDMSLKT